MQSETGVITHDISKKRYLYSLKLFSAFQEKKARQYTTVILTFLALIIFGAFAISPTITTIVELRKQLEDSKLLEKKLDEKIISLQSLHNEFDQIKPDLPIIENAYPLTPETPMLIGQLQNLTKEHNLSVSEIRMDNIPYTKDAHPGGTGAYTMTFTVTGAYQDIDDFTKSVVGFNRLVTVEQIDITRQVAESTNQTTGLLGTATVRAYFDQRTL